MRKLRARVPVGKAYSVREVKLYTKDEARQILEGKDWAVGKDIYSSYDIKKRIGIAVRIIGNGGVIYIEA